jgi:hypothetical protein
LRRADHSSKESYQLSISVRLRNLIRGGQGPIWPAAPYKKEKKGIQGVIANRDVAPNANICHREDLRAHAPTVSAISQSTMAYFLPVLWRYPIFVRTPSILTEVFRNFR